MPSTLNKLDEVAFVVHVVSFQHEGVGSDSSVGLLQKMKDKLRTLETIKSTNGNSTDSLHSVMICKDTMKDFVTTVTRALDYMKCIASNQTLDMD